MTIEKWKIIKGTIVKSLIALVISTLIFKPNPYEVIACIACLLILVPYMIKSQIKKLAKDKKNE